jgi:hypothetical protein
MAQQACVVVCAAEREQLAAIVGDRGRPRKHVEWARIVLASADRHSAQRVAQSIGVSRPRCGGGNNVLPRARLTVCRATNTEARQGADCRGNESAGGGADPRLRGGRLCTELPHQATQWTGRAMANAIGI